MTNRLNPDRKNIIGIVNSVKGILMILKKEAMQGITGNSLSSVFFKVFSKRSADPRVRMETLRDAVVLLYKNCTKKALRNNRNWRGFLS